MKLIIAGTRTIKPTDAYIRIERALPDLPEQPTEIVSGGCRGADWAGEHYALNNKIALRMFPADWEKFGRSAGPRRNQVMAEYADQLLVIWDGQSRGTANMIEHMKRLNKKVWYG